MTYCGLSWFVIPLLRLGEARPELDTTDDVPVPPPPAAAEAAAAAVKFNAGGLGGLSFGMGLRFSPGTVC